MSPAHLFVPSVPWRQDALLGIIACLGKQTKKIPVTFILDGYDQPGVEKIFTAAASEGLDFKIRHHLEPRGAGARWLYALELSDEYVMLSLDDDMIPGPTYIERTLAAWDRLQEPLSWSGDRLSTGTHILPGVDVVEDTRLLTARASTTCFPVKLMRGIENDPAVDRYFGLAGHDEALVSWYMTVKHRVRLWCPKGPSDVAEHHAASYDPRSQWISAGITRYTPLMNELYHRGWPVIDAPDARPPHVRRDQFRRRVEENAARQARRLAERYSRGGVVSSDFGAVVAAWEAAARTDEVAARIHPSGTDPGAYEASGMAAARSVMEAAPAGSVVLDYGCGNGRVLRFLGDYFKSYGYDTSETMRDLARTTCPKAHIIDVVPEAFFDLVYAHAVFIHHTHANGAKMLADLTRCVRPGGIVAAQIPIFDVAREPESWIGVCIWTRPQLEEAARAAGLEVIKLYASPGAFTYETVGVNYFQLQEFRRPA